MFLNKSNFTCAVIHKSINKIEILEHKIKSKSKITIIINRNINALFSKKYI